MMKTTPINSRIDKEENELHQYFTEEELKEVSKELKYIEKHPEEYKSYDNIKDLKEDLIDND